MAPEPIWTTYFINDSHKSVRQHVYFATKRLGKNITAATDTLATIEELLGALFSMWSVSKESLWVCQCILLSLLANSSVNTFLRQRGFIGGLLFVYAILVSKESRRLILPRISCLCFKISFFLSCTFVKLRACYIRLYRREKTSHRSARTSRIRSNSECGF
jgi:hypothetical protein